MIKWNNIITANIKLTVIQIGLIKVITNVSLIGIGCVVLGAVLLMTAVILFTIVTVVKEK